ncbi:hypothetical protein E2C01_018377 [Portunus trituberculatus]|uniref:Uncharacterized protein n=1 Tax=Portunus trituberculatus TaxID=210409 RepID=A0A5B7DW86_PORTR|nr:hypothetical protein [Portunus trituberculatus]
MGYPKDIPDPAANFLCAVSTPSERLFVTLHSGVSVQIVSRRIHELGYTSHKGTKKPLLHTTQVKPVNFVHNYAQWTESDWGFLNHNTAAATTTTTTTTTITTSPCRLASWFL